MMRGYSQHKCVQECGENMNCKELCEWPSLKVSRKIIDLPHGKLDGKNRVFLYNAKISNTRQEKQREGMEGS